MRELFVRLSLVLFSTLLGFAACETVLRLALELSEPNVVDVQERLESSRQASPERSFGRGNLKGLVQPNADPDIIYELKPGLRGRFLGQPFAFNAAGLRGREVEPTKPAGTVRIVGLGDSVMFGWGVAQDEVYLEVLAERLNETAVGTRRPAMGDKGRRPRFETLNFAVPGYNTAMEVAVFEHKALDFDPDLVLLHVIGNDLRLPNFLHAPREPWALDRSYFVDLFRLGWDALAERHRPRLVRRAEIGGETAEPTLEPYRHLEGEDGFRRAMARLARLTQERAVPVLVIALGASGDPWDLVLQEAARYRFETLISEPIYSSYLEDQGLGRTPESWTRTFFVSRRDHHPNALGHRLLAEALVEKLDPLLP